MKLQSDQMKDPYGDGEDAASPLSGRRRSYSPGSRSCSLARTAAPTATHDRDSLIALYVCTGGAKAWRCSLGWPNVDRLPARISQGMQSTPSPTATAPSASQNPFRKSTKVEGGGKAKHAAGSAASVAEPGLNCSTRQRRGGSSSPGNPFGAARGGNPFAPPTPTTSISVSKAIIGQVSPAVSDSSKRRGRATPVPPSPHPVCSSPPTAAAAAIVRSIPSENLPSHSLALVDAGDRTECRFPPPSANAPTRPPTKTDLLQRRCSQSLEAGAAWFGVSLGTASRVTELRLVDNGLTGTLPDALDGLEMLRYLHLGRNALLEGTIPMGISSLANLEWLNLSENSMTGPVPGALSNLSKLVELNLSGNRLSSSLPPELCGMATLNSLQLAHNNLEGCLPVEISKLSALVTLCLDHNRFCGPIPTGVSGMKALQELRLDHNRLTGRIPLGFGKMRSLRILSLSNNLLRGSMPEGLIMKLGATKVQKCIMPGNRLADVDTAMLLLRRPLQGPVDRGLLIFSLMAAYVDLATDIGAAVTFYLGRDIVSFILAVFFILAPTCAMVANTMAAARGRDRNKKILLTIFQLRLVWEARAGLAKRRETRDYKTAKFVEACLEAAPQMLLQTVALASLWNDKKSKPSDAFVAFSILNSVFSVSWETMGTLDRGWAEESVAERARLGTSWPCGASAHHWLLLLCLWLFHVCEVGWRGASLAVLALTLREWSVLVMLGVLVMRVAIAKATEASDLKATKVLIKALVACLLDSIWDSEPAYIAASICTLIESSAFFVVAVVKLRSEGTPLGEAMSDVAWVAGSVYALRCGIDLWLRAPLHWGPLSWSPGPAPCWRIGAPGLRGARGGSARSATRSVEEPPSVMATTPEATPAERLPRPPR